MTGVGTMLAAFALGRLLTSVAVTPGGIGLVEAGSVALLVAMGADPAQAASGILLFTIFTHILEIPFGVLAWLVWLWGRGRGSAVHCHRRAAGLLGGRDDAGRRRPSQRSRRIWPRAAGPAHRPPDPRVTRRPVRGCRTRPVKRLPSTGFMVVGPACRYHSRPNTQPNSGGGIRVKTPSVRGPLSAVA